MVCGAIPHSGHRSDVPVSKDVSLITVQLSTVSGMQLAECGFNWSGQFRFTWTTVQW